jgi:hypothetical protein
MSVLFKYYLQKVMVKIAPPKPESEKDRRARKVRRMLKED